MAPGQAPHHTGPWQDAHTPYLLSPLMGFLSRAWSLLRGPGSQLPRLLEAGTVADEIETGVEEDSRAAEGDGEAAAGPSLELKASSSVPEAWGPSCGEDVENIKEEADGQPPRKFTHSQPAPLSASPLLSALPGTDKSPREEQAEGRKPAEEERSPKASYLASQRQGVPSREDEEDGEAVNKEAAATSASSLAPRPKPSTWLCCPGEEEERATEDKGTENKEAGEAPNTPWRSGSCPRTWQSHSEGAAEKGSKAKEAAKKGEADPEPRSSVPTQGLLFGPCEGQPRENAEEEEGADEAWDSESAEKEKEAEGSSTPTTNAFLKAWAYRPGEATEEEEEEEPEDEDGDSESAEEGEAEASSTTSPFLRAWVYRPGEDTEEEEEEDEDRDSGSAEEGEGEASSTNPFLRAWVYQPGEDTEEEEEEEDEDRDSGSAEEGEAEASSTTSPFLRAWVYRPGEDTEDDWEENQDAGNDSGAAEDREADWGPRPSLQLPGAPQRAWTAPPAGETREEQAAEVWAGAEPGPLAVAIYVPGQKPPAPWPAPKLPLRLQRRLQLSETLTQDRDPETPLKDRKVRFSEKVTVHLLAVWAGPAQAARRGPWEQLALPPCLELSGRRG
ncbi:protein phosphatase 1 regulatory subunit 15A [Fukomys damarensis]|uniref:protein phosphatase 1 regulatory subunit 15A n=1 Tax=Fukomys damarensis TaxID=885580 RepID=UPI000540360F|nr:protein phosphatase 1 regulatory subunit 15A [Fukomys damarensis]